MQEVRRGVRRGEQLNESMTRQRSILQEENTSIGECEVSNEMERIQISSAHVRFNRQVKIQEIKHVRNMNDDEISNTWFTPFDYTRIRAELKYAAHMLEHGGEEIEQHLPGICLRGLGALI